MSTAESHAAPIPSPDDLRDGPRETTREHVVECASLGNTAITQQIDALEREWHLERIVELGAAVLAAAGIALGATKSPRWFVLPGIATAVLAQQAVLGFSPPGALLRRLGVRSRREIDVERIALKALRGDFRMIAPARAHPSSRATQALLASEA